MIVPPQLEKLNNNPLNSIHCKHSVPCSPHSPVFSLCYCTCALGSHLWRFCARYSERGAHGSRRKSRYVISHKRPPSVRIGVACRVSPTGTAATRLVHAFSASFPLPSDRPSLPRSRRQQESYPWALLRRRRTQRNGSPTSRCSSPAVRCISLALFLSSAARSSADLNIVSRPHSNKTQQCQAR